MNVFELFMEGGPLGMALLTILLVLMLFAAWKAPAWVKEIGLAALDILADCVAIFFAALFCDSVLPCLDSSEVDWL